MNIKILMPAVMLALGAGIYIGKSYYSKTETVEVEKERIVKDVVTVVKEVTRPDGTKETETITTDKSKESKDSKSSEIALVSSLPDWHVSISGQTKTSPFELGKPVYGLQIERRIIGPFGVGVRAQTDGAIGLVVVFEF